jgi:Superfamily II DNA/RNA helicases, SNF2 family
MKNGKPLSLEDESFETLALLSDVLPIESDKFAPGQLEIPSYRALYVDAVLKGAEGLEYRRSDTFKSLVRSIRDWEDNSMVIPQDVEATLRSYQLKGCQWLMSLAENNLGGILADDMGLGKTLEMLTVFASYRQTHGKLSALVVAPASLLLNWVNEMHRFTPSLKGAALLGSAAERKRLFEKGADVIVTSYDLIRRDEALFQGKKFDFIVLDEAQTIKNDHTKISKAVKGIDAAHRFALTGTPIQNRLSDLWSIFDFLMPGFLFSRAEFKKRWETPAGKKDGDEVLEKLKKITAPFVLRRLKSNVLRELPQKTVGVRAVPMESEQSKLYQANYVLARKEFNQIVKKQGLKTAKSRFWHYLHDCGRYAAIPVFFMKITVRPAQNCAV